VSASTGDYKPTQATVSQSDDDVHDTDEQVSRHSSNSPAG